MGRARVRLVHYRYLLERRSPRARCAKAVAGFAASVVVATGFWLAPLSAAGAATTSPTPLTAGGCNQAVCIYVEGSGSSVTYWSTTAVFPVSMCSVPEYWANGVIIREGQSKCASAGERVLGYWSDPGYFAPGTVLCNTWRGIPGKPCETVE